MAANAFIKNYFGFNRQQRNGLFVLLLISFFLLIVRLLLPLFITPADIRLENLPLIERRLDSAAPSKQHFTRRDNYAAYKKHELFAFDPNTVSFKQLLLLGFTEKKAGTFIKFRERGFVFREKKDLQKVYGISIHFYERLEPYILIKNTSVNPKTLIKPLPAQNVSPPKKQNPAMVELNLADSAALEALPGIGGAFARRILKYRSALGGYVNTEQLREVYGFNDELFEKVKPFVRADASLLRKINLNKDDFKTINKHPYLSYELTKTIFNFKRKTPITAANLKEMLADEALYQKLLPYLLFE
ncbi:MAG TPA: helix-hairpin-helix domain-containing protein [Bacteroidia bacterium]|nr:helix-hairpin-helix domain-containing protein [Bacteroidia bacterium]